MVAVVGVVDSLQDELQRVEDAVPLPTDLELAKRPTGNVLLIVDVRAAFLAHLLDAIAAAPDDAPHELSGGWVEWRIGGWFLVRTLVSAMFERMERASRQETVRN